ncbi:hypothetical protein AB0G54_39005 [Streptomyces yokosukanensis]|uniref:hypothetical protein n=1 Tax=Streptomyces yokosukanensis TaxID=67386 RepID=UPI000AC8A531|nr:hypothetical protein [Streptomyces yokosukanensis]
MRRLAAAGVTGVPPATLNKKVVGSMNVTVTQRAPCRHLMVEPSPHPAGPEQSIGPG